MADLIERDALLDKMEGRYKFSSGQAHKAYGIAIDDICDAPAVDAVPVVRCKDCRYFSAEDMPSCTSAYGMTDPEQDDFCSYGERRKDDAAD